jgi:hypothetical protein
VCRKISDSAQLSLREPLRLKSVPLIKTVVDPKRGIPRSCQDFLKF